MPSLPTACPSHTGVRTEQDLYVRLIDSVTKQVRPEGRPLVPHFPGCLVTSASCVIYSIGFTLLFTSSLLWGTSPPRSGGRISSAMGKCWVLGGDNEGLNAANNYWRLSSLLRTKEQTSWAVLTMQVLRERRELSSPPRRENRFSACSKVSLLPILSDSLLPMRDRIRIQKCAEFC